MKLNLKLKFFLIGIFCAGSSYAAYPTGLSGIPGWMPYLTTMHYHVQTAWYDSRSSQNRIGMQFVETPGYQYFYYYNTSSQISMSQANAIYSTLLSAITTGIEASIAVTAIDPSVSNGYKFEVAQLGQQ